MISLAASACAAATPFAATVNGKVITSAVVEDELRAIASNTEYVALVGETQQVKVDGAGLRSFDASIAALTLTRQIYYQVVEEELRKRKLTVTTDDVNGSRVALASNFDRARPGVFAKFPEDYQQILARREAELSVLALDVLDVDDVEAVTREAYEGLEGEFFRYCVHQIKVATREQALAIKARVEAGEKFETLAAAESIDASTRARGGDLGCEIQPGTLAAPSLSFAMGRQEVGVVGEPVEGGEGEYHLLRVDSKRKMEFAEAAPLARSLIADRGQNGVQALLTQAVEEAEIVVNPRFGVLDRAASQLVLPDLSPPSGGGPAGDPGLSGSTPQP